MRRLATIGVVALALLCAGAAGGQAAGSPWGEILERVGLVEANDEAQNERIARLEQRVLLLERKLFAVCKKVAPDMVRCSIEGKHVR